MDGLGSVLLHEDDELGATFPSSLNKLSNLSVTDCPCCGNQGVPESVSGTCVKCGSAPRNRALEILLRELIIPRYHGVDKRDIRVLAHTLETRSKQSIERYTQKIRTVLTSWRDLLKSENIESVCKLGTEPSESVDIVISQVTLDFITDYNNAISSAYRVIVSGGVFVLEIRPYRVEASGTAPRVEYYLAPDKYDLPADSMIPSMKVGSGWILSAFRRIGFNANLVKVQDGFSGSNTEWFVGIKSSEAVSGSDNLDLVDYDKGNEISVHTDVSDKTPLNAQQEANTPEQTTANNIIGNQYRISDSAIEMVTPKASSLASRFARFLGW